MRIALVGLGKMGAAVEAEAIRRGHRIVARFGRSNADADWSGAIGDAEVAIEFTAPAAAADNILRLLALGVPIVSGTTGWMDRMAEIEQWVRDRGGALVHAANFSVGAHLLFRTAQELSRTLARLPQFDAAIRERHHRHKKDAPSGTATMLRQYVRAVDPSRDYPISSERVGWNPGEHELVVEGEHETLRLSHAVRDRRVFAAGAVLAAEWLAGRTGFFRFEQVLFGDES